MARSNRRCPRISLSKPVVVEHKTVAESRTCWTTCISSRRASSTSCFASSRISRRAPDAPPVYDLFAVSEHIGGLRGGHYTAVARRLDGEGGYGPWYAYNDCSVNRVDASRVVTPQAYVLFYQRRQGALRWGGRFTTY